MKIQTSPKVFWIRLLVSVMSMLVCHAQAYRNAWRYL